MRIKTKVSLGVGVLFVLITVLIVVGVIYINKLTNDTQNILVANYNTIDYVRQMYIALDEDITSDSSLAKFRQNLASQQNNISEVGELELTNKLALDFEKLKANSRDSLIYIDVRKDLADIMLVNMEAIQRKSAVAIDTATSATTVLAVTGTLCFVLAFTLLLNLPGSIANPIKELTNSIKEIAAKNYSQRVHFEGHNEFGEVAKSFNTMAQKLQEYNNSNLAKILMEKKRIETLINNMHDPIIGLDENKRIMFINNEALKIAGLKLQETLGQEAKQIATNNDLIRLLIQPLTEPAATPGKVENKPLKIYADNKESYFSKEVIGIELTPTAETEAKHIGDVILLKNITPFKEIDVAKTNFIATVSHEFKTPISSIKMSLQLLENEQTGSLNADQKTILTGIHEDADRLLKITGELLNMTQVESGQIQLSILPSDPKEILNDAINAVKIQADQKKIILELHLPQQLPKVQADGDKTIWVLTNLISNAIRYSYENSTVYLSISKENGNIKFAVRDTGQGIAPQYIHKVFDRYFRIPGTKKEGTGLGLAISKEFIEAQGGQITAESDYGSGSIFTVLLKSIS